MPSTRAPASSSGPPELPGLIEASVWIAPSIWNLVSDSTERSVAETTPTESDCCSPKGLPIAATGWPTTRSWSSPSFSGCSSKPSGSTFEQGDVGEGVEADDLGRDDVAVGELDEDFLGRLAGAARFVGDDVGVGDDAAVVVEDEARALGGAAAAAEDRADRDHARGGLAVDLGRRRSRRSAVCTTTRGAASVTVAVWPTEPPSPPPLPQPASSAAAPSASASSGTDRGPSCRASHAVAAVTGALGAGAAAGSGRRARAGQVEREGGEALAGGDRDRGRPCAGRARGRSPGRAPSRRPSRPCRSARRCGCGRGCGMPGPSSETVSSARRLTE